MSLSKKSKKHRESIKEYVDGTADSPYEYFMLIVIIINVISLGMETSKSLMDRYSTALCAVDLICLMLFIIEIIVKFIAYNKEFFLQKKRRE